MFIFNPHENSKPTDFMVVLGNLLDFWWFQVGGGGIKKQYRQKICQ